MNSVSGNNGSATFMLKYADYMSKYVEMSKGLEEFDNQELNTEEKRYYVEVSSRIYRKLGEATIE